MLLEITDEEGRFLERLRWHNSLRKRWLSEYERLQAPVRALCRERDALFETTTAAQRLDKNGPYQKMQRRIFDAGREAQAAIAPLEALRNEAFEGLTASVKEVGLWGYDFSDVRSDADD